MNCVHPWLLNSILKWIVCIHDYWIAFWNELCTITSMIIEYHYVMDCVHLWLLNIILEWIVSIHDYWIAFWNELCASMIIEKHSGMNCVHLYEKHSEMSCVHPWLLNSILKWIVCIHDFWIAFWNELCASMIIE